MAISLLVGMLVYTNPGDVTTSGTSAYRELALTYNQDHGHGTGSAYPGTPGHFNDPVACSD